MKTTYNRGKLIHDVERLCDWFESQEGLHVMLHAEDGGFLGQMAQSKLGELECSLAAVFDAGPDPVVINLTDHQFALDAYCEVMDVVRQIEERRRLPEGALSSRIFILDGSNVDSPEHQKFLEERQAKLVQGVLQKPPTPLYPFESALKELESAIIS